MPHIGRRGRGLGTIALAVVLAGLGLAWMWVQRPADPLEQGWAAYERGEWETAAGLARVRLKTRTNDVDALRLLARASVRLGRDDSARRALSSARSASHAGRGSLPPGNHLDPRWRRPAGALQVWEQARSVDPNHAETLFELTRAYLAADRPLAAAETGRLLATCPGLGSRGPNRCSARSS